MSSKNRIGTLRMGRPAGKSGSAINELYNKLEITRDRSKYGVKTYLI